MLPFIPMLSNYFRSLIFFSYSGFPFTDTNKSQDSRGRQGTIFYSTLPFPPAHKHPDIYLQLCMWDDYHVSHLPSYWFTIWLIDRWCNVRLFIWWFDSRFLLQKFDMGNRWIWTRINYYPRITSEPTNQVC